MRISTLAILCAGSLALAACSSSGGSRPLPPVQQAPTVDGAWVDPNGLISTFAGGRLETRTSDGSNTLMASGTYTMQSNNLVQISLFSAVKQTTTQANCALVTPNQLNCTSAAGAQFSLSRKI